VRFASRQPDDEEENPVPPGPYTFPEQYITPHENEENADMPVTDPIKKGVPKILADYEDSLDQKILRWDDITKWPRDAFLTVSRMMDGEGYVFSDNDNGGFYDSVMTVQHSLGTAIDSLPNRNTRWALARVKSKYLMILSKFIETHAYNHDRADQGGEVATNEVTSRAKFTSCLILLSQPKDIVDYFSSTQFDPTGDHHWLFIMKTMFTYKMADEMDKGKSYLGKTMQCMNAVMAMVARPMLDKAIELTTQPSLTFEDLGTLAIVQRRCGYLLGGIEGGIVIGWTEDEARIKERQALFMGAIDILTSVGLASSGLATVLEQVFIKGVVADCLKKSVLIATKQASASLAEPVTEGTISTYTAGMQTTNTIGGMFSLIIGGNSKMAITLMQGVNTWISQVATKALVIKDHQQQQ